MHTALPDSRTTWIAYSTLMSVVALTLLADLSGLPLDTHDADYFHDSADALTDPATFFSPDKRIPGRPGLELVLLLQYITWGEDAAAYHLFSGLLHLIAALVLSRAGRAMGLDLIPAMLAGLLFLVNISHFNAVHWISAQCYPLVLICGSLALIAYSCNRPFLVYILLLLGILCHISAAAFWPLLLYLARRQDDRVALRRYLPLGLLLALSILTIKFGYPRAPQTTIIASSFDPAGTLQNLLVNWSRLFSTAHWLPHNLYEYQIWELFLGAFGFLAFVLSQWRFRFSLNLSQAWIFVHLLPQMLLSPAYIWTISSGPSRYLYVAAASSSILLALGLDWIRRRVHVYATAALLLTILVSSYHSLNQVRSLTIYTAGRHYTASGDLEMGIALLQRAIDHAPEIIDTRDAYYRICNLQISLGKDFTQMLLKARTLFPDDDNFAAIHYVMESLSPNQSASDKALSRIGNIFNATREIAVGENRILRSVIATAYYNAALGLSKHGQYNKAIDSAQHALAWETNKKEAKELLNTLKNTEKKRLSSESHEKN